MAGALSDLRPAGEGERVRGPSAERVSPDAGRSREEAPGFLLAHQGHQLGRNGSIRRPRGEPDFVGTTELPWPSAC